MIDQNEKDILDILTGDENVDCRIKIAHERGMAYGRKNPDTQQLIQQRVKLARAMIRTFGCTPEQAADVLQLSKKDRKPVLRILAAQNRQKKIARRS